MDPLLFNLDSVILNSVTKTITIADNFVLSSRHDIVNGSYGYSDKHIDVKNRKPFIIGIIPPQDPVNYKPVVKNNYDIKDASYYESSGSKEWGSSAFKALESYSNVTGIKPKDALALFSSESDLKTNSKGSIAGGLNGMAYSLVEKEGVSKETFLNMDPDEQINFISNYYNKYSYPKGAVNGDPAKAYAYNFLPASMSKWGSSGVVVGPPSDPNSPVIILGGGLDAEASYEAIKSQNPAFFQNGKQSVTLTDMGGYIEKAKLKSNYNDISKKYDMYKAGKLVDNKVDTKKTKFTISSYNNKVKEKTNGKNIEVDNARYEALSSYIDGLAKNIETLKQTPSVLFIVNPSDMSINIDHSLEFVRTRNTFVSHSSHVKPIAISIKGVSSGQYVVNQYTKAGGLSSTNRINTVSYKNLMSIAQVYKNNGTIVSDTPGSEGIITHIGSVFIYYDGVIYIGSFDDFSIQNDSSKAYNMSYDFKFTARHIVEV